MREEELKVHISRLEELLNEFQYADMQYQTGRNKKIRDKAERDRDLVLDRFQFYVEQDFELYKLLTNRSNDYHGAIVWEEFVNPRYFENDLREALERIKREVNA